MPVHIGDLSSEIEAFEGELPLSETQLEQITKMVIDRLDERTRRQRQRSHDTLVKDTAARPAPIVTRQQ